MNNRGEDAQYRLDVCCPASQVICLTLSRLNGSPRTGKFIERVVGTRKSEGNSTAEFASYSSLPQHFCEKYGADHEKKCHQNRSLENPYRTVAVQRFGERGRERTPAGLIAGSAVQRFARKYPRNVGFLTTSKRTREISRRRAWRRERNWNPTFSTPVLIVGISRMRRSRLPAIGIGVSLRWHGSRKCHRLTPRSLRALTRPRDSGDSAHSGAIGHSVAPGAGVAEPGARRPRRLKGAT
jgi:hypothetical protein